jgi:hypothetical protein
MENVLFFSLTGFFLVKCWRGGAFKHADHQLLALFYCFFLFATCQFILCGLISYNFGALSRYRMPGFPAWYMLPAILASMSMKKARIVLPGFFVFCVRMPRSYITGSGFEFFSRFPAGQQSFALRAIN